VQQNLRKKIQGWSGL